jgi:hypothetical protein
VDGSCGCAPYGRVAPDGRTGREGRTTTAAIALTALLATSCGAGNDGEQQATDERVAALEGELADAERRADDLAAPTAGRT